MIFYRYRSAKAIFEFQELEKQTIYFAPKESLNDPLEGNLNVEWNGDAVAWRGLFGNYISSLAKRIEESEALLCSLEQSNTLKKQFLQEDYIQDLIKTFAAEEVILEKAELQLFLKLIHRKALSFFLNKKSQKKMPEEKNKFFVQSLCMKLEKGMDDREFLAREKLAAYSQKTIEEKKEYFKRMQDALTAADLIAIANLPEKFDQHEQQWISLYFDYPDLYVEELLTAIHPKCYVACFSESGTNSSMWGNYADQHRGICMMFQSEEKDGVYSLPVQAPISGNYKKNSRDETEYQDFMLKKVEYGGKPSNVNFFTMLGRLDDQSLKEWLMDENGKTSWCLDRMKQNPELWKEEYWKYFDNRYHRKTGDWKYEKEYRLQLGNGYEAYKEMEDRSLRYQFHSLYGIIFGISTPMEDKVKIIRIIQKLCKQENRKDFVFYQAHFDSNTGKIHIEKLLFAF